MSNGGDGRKGGEMTDRLTDGSDKRSEQLADCAAYWIGYREG